MSTVTQWYLLGIYLGVDLTTLAAIKADHEDTKDRLTHTLIQWWNHVTPTWSAVVKALVGIGREKLAGQLAAKYGMAVVILTYQLLVHNTENTVLLISCTEVSLPDGVDNAPLERLIDAVKQNEVRL